MLKDERTVYISDTLEGIVGYANKKLPVIKKGNEEINKYKNLRDKLRYRITTIKKELEHTKKDSERYDKLLKMLQDTEEEEEICLLVLEDLNKDAPRHKPLKRKIKKRTLKQIEVEILKIIEFAKTKDCTWLTKEDVARYLQVKECQVEQVFMKLNREGILGQAEHRAPHDSCRDPYGFDSHEWMSDHYRIL